MIQEVRALLKKHYGYSDFRKGQEKIITSILQGKDTFAIMPTGGGKSICYQLPALMLPGITLVISPLISLMKDQVDALDNAGIPAAYINSSLSQSQLEERISSAAKGRYKLLYIAPERLESERFLSLLERLSVSLLAVDEAHCVSQWGHDFRPSYISIPSLISRLQNRPVIAAFTATATEEVKDDIVRALSLKSPDVFVTGFDRENLNFSVIKGANKKDFVTEYLFEHKNEPGIIYAATRKEVDNLYAYLNLRGISSARYHAGMSDIDRAASQEAFLYDNVQVMVATNAFGMGIDKSNVRFVIHYNIPRHMESYYQEAGRAGRDGSPSQCILLYSASDLHIQKFLIEETLLSPERKNGEYKKLQIMVDYCHTPKCLRKYILQYFGEEDAKETCGNCSNCNNSDDLCDITVEAQKIFSCIKRMGEQYGINLTANVLRGANTKKIIELGFNSLSTYAIMKEYTIKEISDMISLLTAEGYIQIKEGKYPVLKLCSKSIPVLQGKEKVLQRVRKKEEKTVSDSETLFGLLRALRKEISSEEGIPPYIVFHDNTLQEMSRRCPTSNESMLLIPGVGEGKLKKYGSRFIEVIGKYAKEHGIESVNPASEAATESIKDKKIPTHIITMNMYSSGKTLQEIGIERNLSLVTIQSHIVKCAQEGMIIDWSAFIPAQYESRILKAAQEHGIEKLRPLKDILPEEIDYFAIRAVICKHWGA